MVHAIHQRGPTVFPRALRAGAMMPFRSRAKMCSAGRCAGLFVAGRLLFCLWLAQVISAAQTAGSFSSQVLAPAYRADRILIQPKAAASLAALAFFHSALKSEVLQTFEGIGGLQVLRVPEGESVQSLIARYQQSNLVEFAEPDYTGRVFATPDDPKYLDGTLWGLNNAGQKGGTADADIDAPEAWDVLTSASNIVVAVLDTGVRYTHEDLAANMWVNPTDGSHGTNAIAGSNDPSDDSGHIDVTPTYPASYDFDNVISVTYTTRNDALGTNSNYGATSVDLAAPGEQIYSTFGATDSFYFSNTGSSFAAPYVTGALALMLAKYPAESYQQIIARVLNATDPLPSLAGKCVTGGRLNLRKALSPPISLTALSSAGSVPFQLRVSADPGRSCVIEVTTYLTNWSRLFTNTSSANGTFDFTDDTSVDSAQRFY